VNSRLKALTSQFSKHNLDALIVPKDVNIRYLTHFAACESWLLVTPKKAFYITDFRYILEANQGLKDAEVVRYEKSFYDTAFELAKKLGLKKIGIDERHISLALYKSMAKALPVRLKLVEANQLVENLREIKEKEELNSMREALKIHQGALKFIKKIVKPGITEYDVFLKLENYVKSKRVGFSFDPIIASGPNSCLPHGRVSSRKIKNNEPVLLDFGIDYKGYKSDLTRMCFLGRMPSLVTNYNEFVRRAQHKAIASIKAGVAAQFVDAQARNYLKEKGLDQFFGHSLGHGVGLEIHENPRLSQTSPTILKEGMVVTVEPAVYIPNQFGIRLEEMILVRKTDCEVLSGYID
jgi:Xaa-Pro aminopeptidase